MILSPFVNEYFDNVYVINLDTRKDRLGAINRRLVELGIEYERFPAIKIGFEDVNSNNCRFFEKGSEKYIVGQAGCRASHVEILRKARAAKENRILILEDDSDIKGDIGSICSNAVRQIKNERLDWDMLYVGGLYEFGGYYIGGDKWYQEFVGPNVLRLKGAMETRAYGISNERGLYDFVVDNAYISGYEIDIFYYKMHQHCKQFSYFGVYPVPIKGDGSESDIK